MFGKLKLFFKMTGVPRWIFVSAAIVIMFTAASYISMSFVQKIIIDYVIPSGNYTLLAVLAVFTVSIFILMPLSLFTQDIFLTLIKQKMFYYTMNTFLKNYFGIEYRSIQQYKVGDLLSRVMQTVTPIQDFLSSLMFFTFFSLFATVVLSVIMFLYSPWLFLVSIMIIPLQFLVGFYYGRKIKAVTVTVQSETSAITSQYQNTFTGLIDIKTNRLADYFGLLASTGLRALYSKGFRKAKISFTQKFTHDLITATHTMLLLLIISVNIVHGTMTPGLLFFFLMVLGMFSQPVYRLNLLNDQFQSSITALERLNELYLLPTEGNRGGTAIERCTRLTLEAVSFAYNGQKNILNKVNAVFEPGTLYALTGPSGCGKSTLLKIIAGLYEQNHGRVYLTDGKKRVDRKDVGLYEYRGLIGYCSQKNQIFTGSVKDNILMGDDALKTDLLHAAQAAAVDSFIDTLENGYDTVISPNDTKLSGGQAQRIALARILVRSPKILLLDEVTSSLDPIVEKTVVRNIKKHYLKDRICIIITHRAETLRMCDKIIRLH